MRFIKTFVLHLFIDSNVPERLCGDVRSLEEDDCTSFKNQLELEELLRKFISKSPFTTETSPDPNSS